MRLRLRGALSLVLALAVIAATPASGEGGAVTNGAAPVPTPEAVVRFVALGDMGTGDSNQYALAMGMTAYHDHHPFDTALMLGDNIYPNPHDPVSFPDTFVRNFARPYAELRRRGVRFYAVLGNHDVGQNREAELNYPEFHMNEHAYYSFGKGNGLVEFFALDSTAPDAAQLRWLDGALAASRACWKIAYFHHPIYSSGRSHGSDTKLRAQFEPLFVRYGVAVALSGHNHTYERTKPQRGVQYFVSGAGGQLKKGDLDRHTPFFAAGNDAVNSFLYFEASPNTLSFRALDAAGKTLDSGVLSRACSRGQAVGSVLMAYGANLAEGFRRAAMDVEQRTQGREARRVGHRAANDVRAGHQHEDRKSPRSHHPAIAVAAGGSGHSMKAQVVRVAERARSYDGNP